MALIHLLKTIKAINSPPAMAVFVTREVTKDWVEAESASAEVVAPVLPYHQL